MGQECDLYHKRMKAAQGHGRTSPIQPGLEATRGGFLEEEHLSSSKCGRGMGQVKERKQSSGWWDAGAKAPRWATEDLVQVSCPGLLGIGRLAWHGL